MCEVPASKARASASRRAVPIPIVPAPWSLSLTEGSSCERAAMVLDDVCDVALTATAANVDDTGSPAVTIPPAKAPAGS